MLATFIPTVELDPPSNPVAVVIWLHGLGADGHDFEPVIPMLKLPQELPLRFVFPHAPEMPISAFGGQRARAWFDFPPASGSELPGLEASVLKIRDLIQREIDNGMPPERILLAGFSQGGVMALHIALFYPKRLAGILALSTFLADKDKLGSLEAAANRDIPILMCHGQQDEVLPMSLGRSSQEALRQSGYAVEWFEYPMGHEICIEEVREISRWLQEVLCQSE
ncbi:MAG: carboxylesterase [Halioglobus sp.]|nr:carboxylesterase [Halioglobus sp.]